MNVKNKTLKMTLISIISLTLLFGLVVLLMPWKSLVEQEIRSQLEKRGIKVTSMKITSLGVKGIEINDFNLNEGALSFKTLNIQTSFNSLLNKSIENIELQGLAIQKEKLTSIVKNQKSSKGNSNSKGLDQNLEQLMRNIPSDEINFSLNSINGLHQELKSGLFPIEFGFKKSKRQLTLKIIDGHIKSFRIYKDIYVSFDAILTILKNHIDIEIKTFNLNFKNKEIKVDFLTEKNISIDLNNDNSLNLASLSLPFQMNIKFQEKMPALSEIVTTNNLILKDSKFYITSKLSHPNQTMTANIAGWLSQTNTQRGEFQFNLLIENLTKENLLKTSPLLSKSIKELEGKIKLEGKVILKEESIRPSLKLIGENLSFQYEESKIKKINLKHHLSSFKTYGSRKLNSLSIEEIDLGLKILQLKTEYKVLNPQKINVNSISLKTYDGLVKAENFSIIENRPKDLIIKLSQFPLNKFLNMALKDGVLATGLIEGTLPIAFNGDLPIINNGRLKNSGKGIIKYNPTKANPLKSMNKTQVNILLSYLKDFSYDQLLIDANSDEEYNLTLNSKFMGTNPNAYNGRPLNLGVNLDFNIKDAIVSSLMFMKIPEKIEERLIKEMEK